MKLDTIYTFAEWFWQVSFWITIEILVIIHLRFTFFIVCFACQAPYIMIVTKSLHQNNVSIGRSNYQSISHISRSCNDILYSWAHSLFRVDFFNDVCNWFVIPTPTYQLDCSPKQNDSTEDPAIPENTDNLPFHFVDVSKLNVVVIDKNTIRDASKFKMTK